MSQYHFGDFVRYDTNDFYGVAYVIGHKKIQNIEIPIIANKDFMGMPINSLFLKLVETGCLDIAKSLREQYQYNFGDLI